MWLRVKDLKIADKRFKRSPKLDALSEHLSWEVSDVRRINAFDAITTEYTVEKVIAELREIGKHLQPGERAFWCGFDGNVAVMVARTEAEALFNLRGRASPGGRASRWPDVGKARRGLPPRRAAPDLADAVSKLTR